MRNPASAYEVTRLLGDVDPIIVERIVSTGASVDEIDEALQVAQDERGFGEQPHIPSSPRVTEVRALLDELAVVDDELSEDDRM